VTLLIDLLKVGESMLLLQFHYPFAFHCQFLKFCYYSIYIIKFVLEYEISGLKFEHNFFMYEAEEHEKIETFF